jgi:hypothetical protein
MPVEPRRARVRVGAVDGPRDRVKDGYFSDIVARSLKHATLTIFELNKPAAEALKQGRLDAVASESEILHAAEGPGVRALDEIIEPATWGTWWWCRRTVPPRSTG